MGDERKKGIIILFLWFLSNLNIHLREASPLMKIKKVVRSYSDDIVKVEDI